MSGIQKERIPYEGNVTTITQSKHTLESVAWTVAPVQLAIIDSTHFTCDV